MSRPADRTTTLTADLFEKDPTAPEVNGYRDCHARAETKPKLLSEIPQIKLEVGTELVTLTNQQAFHRNCAGCHDEIAKTSKDLNPPNIQEMYGVSQEGCSVTRNYFAKRLPTANSKCYWVHYRFPKKGLWVIMKTLKIMTVAAMLAAFCAAMVMVSAASLTVDDASATYKTKCVACHGQKAEKKFDSSLPDEQLIDIVMKGKKPEKPPNMPAYGEKGVTAEQAKALVEHMKQLKSAQ